MDKEQIKSYALDKYNDCEFRIPNAYCFIEGAEWLQSQPLAERLTEKEKEIVRKMYDRLKSMFDMADIEGVIQRRIVKLEDEFQSIFGKDLLG